MADLFPDAAVVSFIGVGREEAQHILRLPSKSRKGTRHAHSPSEAGWFVRPLYRLAARVCKSKSLCAPAMIVPNMKTDVPLTLIRWLCRHAKENILTSTISKAVRLHGAAKQPLPSPVVLH